MSLEALSGSAYHESSKTVAKPKTEITTGQDSSAAGINITEVPGDAKGQSTQTGKDQNALLKEGQVTDKQIKEAISKANSKLKLHKTRCEFSYHEDTNRVSIKVLDSETEEVIKEIPPEQTLEMVEKMWELAGIMIDEKR